jgi:uncharacterized membrane protein YdjX (TVP38/TMEM64 family)
MKYIIKRFSKLIIAIIVFTAIYYVIGMILQKYSLSFDTLKNINASIGIFAVLLFFILITFTVVFPYPFVITAFAVSFLYGPVVSFIVIYLALILGSCINFFLIRFIGKKYIARKAPDIMFLVNDNMKRIGLQLLVFFRLFPVFPFDIVSFGAALTKYKFHNFLISLLIGYLPVSLVYAILGVTIESNQNSKILLSVILSLALIVATQFIVSKYGKKLKLNKLEKKV